MPDLPPRHKPHQHLAALKRPSAAFEHDERRGSAFSRGYDGWWQREARAHLRSSPLCVCCKANGQIKAATLVDHIVPHRGDKVLFRDPANRQSLCGDCHNRIKAVIERLWDMGRLAVSALRLDRPLPEYFDIGG